MNSGLTDESFTCFPQFDLKCLNYRYMFVFQLPWLPEYIWSNNDMARLESAYTKPPTGAKPGTITAEEIEALKYTFGKPGSFTPPINYYRNLFRLFPVRMPHWYPLKFPVLLIFGTADTALSWEAAEKSREFGSVYFELQFLEGISHWVQHEAPDRVNQLIESFLSGQKQKSDLWHFWVRDQFQNSLCTFFFFVKVFNGCTLRIYDNGLVLCEILIWIFFGKSSSSKSITGYYF